MMKWMQSHPTLEAWYKASRPRTLTATYAPLGLAAVIAIDHDVFRLDLFLLSFVAALFLQIASNLINEYADYRRGADALKQAGQGMVIKNRVLTPNHVLYGAIGTTLLGVLIGLYLVTQSGPLLLWIGAGGVLVVVTYTAGPFPLAYHGLGEAAVFIFMGPLMVLGAYYVMSGGQTDWVPVLAGIPLGFMVAAILLANNIRDIEADRVVNKHTLVVMFGRPFARKLYIGLVGGAYVMVAVMIVLRVMPLAAVVVMLTFPEARELIAIMTTSEDTMQLHQAQGRTAKLHGQFGLWLVIGWAGTMFFGTLLG